MTRERFSGAPEADRQPREVRRAERRRLGHLRAHDCDAEQVGLKLQQRVVHRCPAIHSQLRQVDTGIVFHHDRPNCEAPQAMLLVTPSEFRGSWRWEDLVGALNETLDFAKRRAIEPRHIDASPYAPFLPATVVATQVQQLTIALELALNNRIALQK